MSGLVALPLQVGARTLWTVKRRLVRHPLSLTDALAGAMPDLPPLPESEDGYLVTSLPDLLAALLCAAHPDLRPHVRQRYRRSYLSLEGGYDAYFAAFSAKTRSTLKRKLRRAVERSGGTLEVRCYRKPGEMEDFFHLARSVSALTYQERLLDAGLPGDALPEMRELAARDSVRAWILFLDGRAASYLYAPAIGDTLIYAHLGFDPDFADLSPGTVLQLEAIRALMAEGRFRLFDFTEGEGAHKSRFATGSIECVDLLLLRPTLANAAAARTLAAFDVAVGLGKGAARAIGVERLARALTR